MQLIFRFWRFGLLALTAVFAQTATAGSISFNLSLTGKTLVATLHGDSEAFYPAVFRMLADGRWERLPPAVGKPPPAYLASGMHYDVMWPETRPLEERSALERLRPVMVRFFDQAGVSFGQISLFNQPGRIVTPLRARYAGTELSIAPPADNDGIRATWVLWPQEEGIAPLSSPVRFNHVQPPARRIEWRAGMEPVRIRTGAGEPSVILLHETAQGYATQLVPGGGLQGRQQRAAWLDASTLFYRLAALLAGVAAILIVAGAARLRRAGAAA